MSRARVLEPLNELPYILERCQKFYEQFISTDSNLFNFEVNDSPGSRNRRPVD